VKITQLARAGAPGKIPKMMTTVRVFEQHFDNSFCEVLELQKYSWWDIITHFLFSEVNGLNIFKY